MTTYKGDIGLYLSGAQVPIKSCGVFLTPPTIRDIAQFGEDDFLLAVRVASADRGFIVPIKEATPQMEDVPDFQILLSVAESDDKIKDLLLRFFELVFPDYKVEIARNMVCFKVGEEEAMKGMINQFNCEEFFYTVKELFWPPQKQEEGFNPANKKAEEIARKLEAARRRKQNQEGGGGKSSLFGIYASVISIGLAVDINVIYRYTPFQLFDAFNRYMKKSEYDLYMRIKTTPMMDTSKMEEQEHWAVNLYNMQDDNVN